MQAQYSKSVAISVPSILYNLEPAANRNAALYRIAVQTTTTSNTTTPNLIHTTYLTLPSFKLCDEIDNRTYDSLMVAVAGN